MSYNYNYPQRRDRFYNEYDDMKKQVISNGKYLINTSSKRHSYGVDLSEGLDVVMYASDNKCPNKEYKAILITKDGYALAEGHSVKNLNASIEDLLQLTAAVVALKKPQWESRAKDISGPTGKGTFWRVADVLL